MDLLKIALYAWADCKTTLVKIQPGSSVLCEQGENIEWFRVNEKSGQIYPFVLFGFYLVVALGGFTVS